MMMSVDGESCPCCNVVCVTLQFRLEDSSARSVAGLRNFVLCLGFLPLQSYVAGLWLAACVKLTLSTLAVSGWLTRDLRQLFAVDKSESFVYSLLL